MIWFDMKCAISHTQSWQLSDTEKTKKMITHKLEPIRRAKVFKPSDQSAHGNIYIYFFFVLFENTKQKESCTLSNFLELFLLSAIQRISIERICKFVNVIWWVEITDALLSMLIFKIIIENFWRILQKIRRLCSLQTRFKFLLQHARTGAPTSLI